MLCTHIFAPALFNSNVKCKRIRTCLNAKSKPFLAFNKHHFTVDVRKYIQRDKQGNKKLQKFSFVIQPTCRNTG